MKEYGQIKPESESSDTVERFVRFNESFWISYRLQAEMHSHLNRTLVDDALYAIGMGLSDEYIGPDGFKQFKRDLLDYLADTCYDENEGENYELIEDDDKEFKE